jgi:hypothetical protein
VDPTLRRTQPKACSSLTRKAALPLNTQTISQTLQIAVGGLSLDLVHQPREKEM